MQGGSAPAAKRSKSSLKGDLGKNGGVNVSENQLKDACLLSWDSCETLKLSRCGAHDPLEVKVKLTLVQEADAERNLRQGNLIVSTQDLPRAITY
jgi:hypothetical protein